MTDVRRLQAENNVLRRIVTNLDKAITEMQFNWAGPMGGWETVYEFEKKVQAELDATI